MRPYTAKSVKKGQHKIVLEVSNKQGYRRTARFVNGAGGSVTRVFGAHGCHKSNVLKHLLLELKVLTWFH